ncbi:MAG: hypothetical protein V4714_08360 [Bacteroidota bacterium]
MKRPNPLGIPDTPPEDRATLLYTAMFICVVVLIVQGVKWVIGLF